MDHYIPIIIIRDTFKLIPRKSVDDHNIYPCEWVPKTYVADHNMITGTWDFKCKIKPDYINSKFKENYCL